MAIGEPFTRVRLGPPPTPLPELGGPPVRDDSKEVAANAKLYDEPTPARQREAKQQKRSLNLHAAVKGLFAAFQTHVLRQKPDTSKKTVLRADW